MPMFTPFTFGGLALRNRLVMAPMTQNQSADNVLSDANISRYAACGHGGVGLIITEGMLVDHPTAADGWGTGRNRIPILRPALVPSLKKLVTTCHEAGARLMVQVWHQGPQVVGGIAPSAQPTRQVRAASDRQWDELLEAYRSAAQVVVAAGADGAELHAAHGYLLHSCLKHGDRPMAGGRTGRESVAEVVRIFASALARQPHPRVLQLRFSQWEVDDYAARFLPDEAALRDMLVSLCEAGVAAFHASTRRWWDPAFGDGGPTLAALTRRITGRPTTAVGGFGLSPSALAGNGPESLAGAQAAIGRQDFDLMAVGRPLLADPSFVEKLSGGRYAEIVSAAA